MRWIKNISLSIVSILMLVIILEALMRFFPVNQVTRTQPLTRNARPFEVSAHKNGSVVHSKEWNFINARIRRTNNLGFFSDFDYDNSFNGVAVIGDSFVEAVQVNFDETFHQVLSKFIDQPVYNFAISGSPLSQYEAYLSQICDMYDINKVVILIIDNDFDESFFRLRLRRGFFHYNDKSELLPTPNEIGAIRYLANSSSLIKYIYFNLNAGSVLQFYVSDGAPSRQSDTSKVKKDYIAHRQAADIFLARVGNYCVLNRDIIFVVDGPRVGEQGVYGLNDNRPLYLKYFIERAKKLGFKVIDLNNVFYADYKLNGRRFEFPFDEHWNSYGHQKVAEAIYNSGFLN